MKYQRARSDFKTLDNLIFSSSSGVLYGCLCFEVLAMTDFLISFSCLFRDKVTVGFIVNKNSDEIE